MSWKRYSDHPLWDTGSDEQVAVYFADSFQFMPLSKLDDWANNKAPDQVWYLLTGRPSPVCFNMWWTSLAPCETVQGVDMRWVSQGALLNRTEAKVIWQSISTYLNSRVG